MDYADEPRHHGQNVAYSPDSVADYTLMLMLMAVRNAKSMLRRVDLHDYRPSGPRGRELRDLTVGVIGTGRIGTAVMDRLRGFGCHVLAYDIWPRRRPPTTCRSTSCCGAATSSRCTRRSPRRRTTSWTASGSPR